MKKFDVTFRRCEYFVVSVEAKTAESATNKARREIAKAEASAETRDLDKMFLHHGDMTPISTKEYKGK
jgi:hypothetical protein